MTATIRVASPEAIAAGGAAAPPYLRPPPATLFAQRAMRLRQLAARGGPLAAFLQFNAVLADAQQQAFDALPAPTEPAGADAPLDVPLPPTALAALPRLLAAIDREALPAAAGAQLIALQQADPAHLHRQADALRHGRADGLDLGAAPFLGAALQVFLMRQLQAVLASGWQAPSASLEAQHHCPACGAPPVASLTVHEAPCNGQRYLHCAHCQLQWQMLRGQCSHCGGQRVAYQSAQAVDQDVQHGAVVQAETCEACGHYLKLMHGDRDGQIDPVADDLASLTLDLLLAEAGLQRHGHNWLLLFGAEDAPA